MDKKNENFVVSHSRVRLARNLTDFPFEINLLKEQKRKLNNLVKDCLKKYNDTNNQNNKLNFLEMHDIPPLNRLSLIDKHIISHEFNNDLDGKMLIVSNDFNTSIMLNEEDHIRIQVIKKGFDINGAYSVADEIDDTISGDLNIAFDKKYGYLTSCPTNVGTGLRVSVMLHLKALEMTKGLDQIIAIANKLGLTVRGSYGEGSKAMHSMYQLSNQITLGITEKQAIENIQNITKRIIDSELEARNILINNNLAIKDTIYKSFGLLSNGLLFNEGDALVHLSNLKFGVSCGLFPSLSIEDIINIEEKLSNATIKCENKLDYTNEELCLNRAIIIKELFKLGEK